MYKYRGMQSFPGGEKNYLNFIINALNKISHETKYRSDIVDWIKSEYKLTGIKAPGWYLHFLIELKLVTESDKGISLTEKGEEFLSTRNNEIIIKTLIDDFLGIDDILINLYENEESNAIEIKNMLEDLYDLEWKTLSQVRRRLIWMTVLNLITREKDEVKLTDYGKKIIEKMLLRNENLSGV